MAKKATPQQAVEKVQEPEQDLARIARYEERAQKFAEMWHLITPRIKALVPQHVSVDRLFAAAITARNRNPDLMDCSEVSVIRGVIQLAQMGFDASGISGKAWLVPFYNREKRVKEAVPIVGYRGLEELARRSGEIGAVYSREIYAHEDFEYVDGLMQVLRHVPIGPLKEGDEAITGAYAVAVWRNGYRQAEVMNRVQLDAIRASSKSPDGPGWKNHFAQMARKTVIRRLCKNLPDSYDLARVLDTEERLELGLVPHEDIAIEQVQIAERAVAPQTRTENLRDKIAATVAERAEAEAAAGEETLFEEGEDPLEREPGEEG